jgi:hypothetical protein
MKLRRENARVGEMVYWQRGGCLREAKIAGIENTYFTLQQDWGSWRIHWSVAWNSRKAKHLYRSPRWPALLARLKVVFLVTFGAAIVAGLVVGAAYMAKLGFNLGD